MMLNNLNLSNLTNSANLSSTSNNNNNQIDELTKQHLESLNLATMLQQQSQIYSAQFQQQPTIRKSLTCIDFNSEIFLSAVQSAEHLLNEPNKSVKTPISLLQEIMIKCGLPSPNYEEVTLDGISQQSGHEPIFGFQVRIQIVDNGEIISVARGSSKKRAKHACAFEVLNQFRLQSNGSKILSEKLEKIMDVLRKISIEENKILNVSSVNNTSETTSTTTIMEDENSNPVGELIELTQKCSLRPPEFEFVDEFGPSHDRQFKCEARLGENKTEAIARSKKGAKRLAAIALLNKLKETNLSANKLFENENAACDELQLNIIKSKEKMNGGKKSVESIQQFKLSTKDSIKKLAKTTDLTALNKSFLEQLALEENFKFQFYKLKPFEQSQRVLLSLFTNPIMVFYGKGQKIEAAIDDASKNALETIQLFCSRS